MKFYSLVCWWGIKNIHDISNLIEAGVEKVSINSILDVDLNLISEISNKYIQSALVSLDLLKKDKIILVQNSKKIFKIMNLKII